MKLFTLLVVCTLGLILLMREKPEDDYYHGGPSVLD